MTQILTLQAWPAGSSFCLLFLSSDEQCSEVHFFGSRLAGVSGGRNVRDNRDDIEPTLVLQYFVYTSIFLCMYKYI